jgi:2-polyprenyl-3-methyl-5-hydroxy-6-metoxy-1,4-benzoquinol methylase
MNNKLNAEKLKNHYEEVYQKGAYENYFTFNSYSIWKAVLDQVEDWRGRSVLEVGCGQGELSAMIAYAGADSIEAIDYSQTAVDIAQERVNLPNVNFACVDGQDVDGIYNLITLAGVLEHTDDPWSFLDKLIDENLSDNGSLITVMPSFMNPRGFIWMTLQTLFDVPMSLSDLHFFSPTDIQEYAKKGT